MLFSLLDDWPIRRAPSKHEKEALYAKQKGKCMYCGRKLALQDMEVDHKNPLANGGGESLANKQVLCGPCNKRKGATTDGQFRKPYALTPTRQAKGPPARPIPLSRFEKTSAEIKKKRQRVDDGNPRDGRRH